MDSQSRQPADEIAAIRALLPPPPPPSPAVAKGALNKLERRTRRRGAIPRWRAMPSRRPYLKRAALTAVAAGAAAAVTAAALTVGGGQSPPPPVARPGIVLRGAPARPFLLAMATTAAHQRIGRYYCQNIVQGDRRLVGKGDLILPQLWANGRDHIRRSPPAGFKYALFRSYGSVDCTRGTKLDWHATSDQYLGSRPASSADTRAWRRDGSPSHWRYGHGTLSAHPGPASASTFVKPGQRGDFGLANYLKLPADPVKLRAFLLAHPMPAIKGRNNVLVEGALTVMRDPVRPAVRAAALKILASVPGLRMRPGVTDPEGQTGTAVWQDSWPGQYIPYESSLVLIDPHTATFIGLETVAIAPVEGAPPGTVLDYSVNIGQSWTNHLPPGLNAATGGRH